jgi:hypothetical protein
MRPLLAFLIVPLLLISPSQHEKERILEFDQIRTFRVRPAKDEKNVSVYTSIYMVVKNLADFKVKPETININLARDKADSIPVILEGKFLQGFGGTITPNIGKKGESGAGIYIVPDKPLSPKTHYTVKVDATLSDGSKTKSMSNSWSFTTEPEISDEELKMTASFKASTISWHGQFFAGIMKPNFNTSKLFHQIDSYKMMSESSKGNPSIWSLQRDWPLFGDFWAHGIWDGNPNLVREKETREISSITDKENNTVLTICDFYGHEQYGIKSNRPPSEDYHRDDVVLIADRRKSETATVLEVDDKNKTVTVSKLKTPAESWKLDYSGSIPKDNPITAGNFSMPRCYLRKFKPSGTLVYFWDRVHEEFDILCKEFGKRLVINFSGTPNDLSIDGNPGKDGGGASPNKPKDYAQYWSFVYTVTDHLIKRFGKRTLEFYYSVCNEYDLPGHFWKDTQEELYRYYDYSIDAVLRAYEDNGLDSNKVKVGGLEIAAIWNLNTLPEFLYHCSPKAEKKGVADQNFAYADASLDGKRSKRVEELCKANGGKGSPCDFISIHQYNKSSEVAKNLIKSKEIALEIDPDFYNNLYFNSFETCPGWFPLPDPAQRAIYKCNGYFSTWAADIIRRLIEKGAKDNRFTFCEMLITVWPFDYNFEGFTSVTGLFKIEGTKPDRVITIKKDIFNFLEIMGKMSGNYFAIDPVDKGGNIIGGFGSRNDDSLQVVLYCHNMNDIETRQDRQFQIELSITDMPWKEFSIEEFKVDKNHSSVYSDVIKLPKKEAYKEEEIVKMTEKDDLHLVRRSGGQATDGTFKIKLQVAVNGVTCVNITKTK